MRPADDRAEAAGVYFNVDLDILRAPICRPLGARFERRDLVRVQRFATCEEHPTTQYDISQHDEVNEESFCAALLKRMSSLQDMWLDHYFETGRYCGSSTNSNLARRRIHRQTRVRTQVQAWIQAIVKMKRSRHQQEKWQVLYKRSLEVVFLITIHTSPIGDF